MTDWAWTQFAIGVAAGLAVRAEAVRWVWPLVEAWTVAVVLSVGR